MKIQNPHDKFFKSFIYDKENAIDFLKTFLPQNISGIIDFGSLSIENNSFISEALSETFSDAIFKCRLKKAKEEVFVSILIEHKSYPDKYIAIQLLNYLANGYLTQLKESNTLQLIIPFIYYHGRENWQYKSLPQIINNIPDYLKEFVPDFNTIFVDLNTMSEAELENINNLMLLSALYMQKYSFSPEQLLSKIVDILTIADRNPQKRGNFLKYIFVYFNELVEIETGELREIIASLPDKTKKDIMTTYQLIKKEGKIEGLQEGIQKGRKEGLEEGLEKGLQKGLEKGVLNLHKRDFTIAQIAEIMEIPVAKVKRILERNN